MEEKAREKKWYAVYTKSRWEKKVADLLSKRNIENYCPLNKTISKWSDRKKVVMEPLFTSYVFVHISHQEFQRVKQVAGIVNFVYWLGKPALIYEEEINTIKKYLYEYEHVELVKEKLYVSDRVRITDGPLMSREGDIVEVMHKTAKIVLPSLGYSMIVNIDKLHIEKVTDGAGAKKVVHVQQHVEQ